VTERSTDGAEHRLVRSSAVVGLGTALSRITGWTAHLLEQYGDNRLVRPNAVYEGAANRQYVAVDQR